VGGASDEHRRPTLVLLPEDGPAASMPISDPRRATCKECPSSLPRRLMLFPPSELTTAAHLLHPYVQSLRTIGPNLEVMSYQGGGHALYVVNPDFFVESFQFSQTYWGAHKALESKGEIDHTADACPDRSSPAEVRQWIPADGWQQVLIRSGPPRPVATSTLSGLSGVVSARLPAK
jgi:hypothetical protein